MFWVSAEHYKAPLKACQLLALTLCLGCHQASHERPLSVFASVITGSQTQHKEPNDEQIVRHPFFLLPIKKKTKKLGAQEWAEERKVLFSIKEPLAPVLSAKVHPLHTQFYSFHRGPEAASKNIHSTIILENVIKRQSQGKYIWAMKAKGKQNNSQQ